MAHNSPPSSNPTDGSAQDLLGQDNQPLEVSADDNSSSDNSSSDALDAEQLKKAADTINQSTSKQVDSDQNNKLGVEIDLD